MILIYLNTNVFKNKIMEASFGGNSENRTMYGPEYRTMYGTV